MSPTRQESETGALAALTVVLLSTLTPAALVAHVLPLLALLGIHPAEGMKALALVVPEHTPPETATSGPALLTQQAQEATRRAQYLVAAAKRFEDPAWTVEDERRYMAQHAGAQQSRLTAAGRVDQAAGEAKAVEGSATPMLGWYAVHDSRTDPICKVADGTNFDPRVPPVIGFPGTVHPFCRCRPGPPHRTLVTVDEAVRIDRQGAVIPFATELSESAPSPRDRLRSILS